MEEKGFYADFGGKKKTFVSVDTHYGAFEVVSTAGGSANMTKPGL